MGLLDGFLSGFVGGEMTTLVAGYIERHGGLSTLISQFEEQGLGAVVHSWVGNGPNQPISPDQLQQVLGSTAVRQWAANLGVDQQLLLQKLAQILPQAVDRMTPAGVVPRS